MMADWREARDILAGLNYDLFVGNDISVLLLAVWQQRVKGKPFIMDYHEYAPLEASEKAWHRWFHGPHSARLLKRYGALTSGASTVNRMFAERFEQEFGFPSVTVMNAPELVELPPAPPRQDGVIHLVFHGHPEGDRNLDVLLRAMPLLNDRFVLHLMLTSGAEPDSIYRTLAAAAPPGRVVFEETVRPAGTVFRLAAWDIGFNILTPLNYNHRHALPNKFFDYIHAGLATVCSDTVTAAELVNVHGIGWVLDSITPECIAALLRSLSLEDIAGRKAAALRLREQIHARAEEARLVAVADKVLAAA
jgi:glycosyltransferase involved in cell wall biosynthesis